MDYIGWPAVRDYQLLAGSIMGILGYSLLQIALSPQLLAYLKTRIARAAKP